jgi:hypothetical protein
MPRNITTGIYARPVGVGNDVPATKIGSNDSNRWIDDVEATLNQVLPINMGGTGTDKPASAEGLFAGRNAYDGYPVGFIYRATDRNASYIRTAPSGWSVAVVENVPASQYLPHYPNRPNATTTNAYLVPADVRYIHLDGFWVDGDVGESTYKRLASVPTTLKVHQFTTNAGTVAWEAIPDQDGWLNAGAFAIKANDSSYDSAPGLTEFCLQVCALNCKGSVPAGNIYIRTQLVWDLTTAFAGAPIIWGKGKGVTFIRAFPADSVPGPAFKITSAQGLSGAALQHPVFYGSFGYFSISGAVSTGDRSLFSIGNGNVPGYVPPPSVPDATLSDVYFNGTTFTNIAVANTSALNVVGNGAENISCKIYGADACVFESCSFAGFRSQPGGAGTPYFYNNYGLYVAHFNNCDVRGCTASGKIAISFKEGKIIANRFNILVSVSGTALKIINRTAATGGISVFSNTWNGGAVSDCEYGIDAPSQGNNRIFGVYTAEGKGAFELGRVVNPTARDGSWGGLGWIWPDQNFDWLGRNVYEFNPGPPPVIVYALMPTLPADDSAINTTWIRNWFLTPIEISLYTTNVSPGSSLIYKRNWDDDSIAAGGTLGNILYGRMQANLMFILAPGESFQWVHQTSTGAGNPLGRTMRLRQWNGT